MENNKLHCTVRILLEQYLQENGISKNKASRDANITRTRFNAYCKNTVQRVDLDVLARLCDALHCNIEDLLQYVSTEA